MIIEELKTHKRILILGYGIEGKATERFLKKFHPEAEIGIADQKDDPNYLDKQKDYDLAVRTPLLRPEKITIPYTTGTNLFFSNVTNTIIGVTGTKGKSTVVSMLYHVLQSKDISSRLLGNIGKPMLDAVTKGLTPNETIILELSSYQLEDIKASPNIACLLNLYKELHNHKTYEEYINAKANITYFQSSDDMFFYNGNDGDVVNIANESAAQKQDFTQADIHELDGLKINTHHSNLQAVAAISARLGISLIDVKSALESFEELPHRMQNVKTVNNITFIDDSASTHPDSTVLALAHYDNIQCLLVGGENRGYDLKDLVDEIAERTIPYLVLFPETADTIETLLNKNADYNPTVLKTDSMDKAVSFAFENVDTGICLLSPGAPSYTMYKNLYERGKDFTRTIDTYAEKKTKDKTNTDESENAS